MTRTNAEIAEFRDHHAEYARLESIAAMFEQGGYNSPEARLRCVTMAHAKRLQAQWHWRRTPAGALQGMMDALGIKPT